MFIQEKRQWGGSEREEGSRKEQEEGVEIMTGEGKRKKDGEMGIIQTQNLMGMLWRE